MNRTIDYVVPMVFPSDPEWRKVLRGVTGTCYDAMGSTQAVRYRSWGTEELLVRCVRKFMPWVRHIFIILAQESQKQPWMDDYGIVVTYHRDFIPERYIPTFNSRTMEMFLYRIPDLSDRFLYGNDDMFPLSPLSEADFFQGGKPCQRYEELPFPDSPNLFHTACLNGLNFVAKDYGKHFTGTWLRNGHGIVPILRSTCIDLWERHPKEISESITPFRDVRNFNQYIWGWEQHFSGNYVKYVPRRCLITMRGEPTVMDILNPILARNNNGIVCINDHEDVKDIEPFAKAARDAIRYKLGEL
ncbi:MAG: hypothetical protein IKH15_06680 [Bacteroidales bacterium]|nr:hypothetical protein [Bacteroidales bacterium]MBR7051614.1 hypothetical protein [Bacteroidaceae bacterium]